MRQPAALFPIALALGATILVPGPGARAAPTAITTCQISQPGSYVLANDLTSSGDCLVITASFVTINLAGFSISTTNGAAITAPSTSPLSGIAVRNGSISALHDGIALDGDFGSIVENLQVSSTLGDGIRATGIVRETLSQAMGPSGPRL